MLRLRSDLGEQRALCESLRVKSDELEARWASAGVSHRDVLEPDAETGEEMEALLLRAQVADEASRRRAAEEEVSVLRSELESAASVASPGTPPHGPLSLAAAPVRSFVDAVFPSLSLRSSRLSMTPGPGLFVLDESFGTDGAVEDTIDRDLPPAVAELRRECSSLEGVLRGMWDARQRGAEGKGLQLFMPGDVTRLVRTLSAMFGVRSWLHGVFTGTRALGIERAPSPLDVNGGYGGGRGSPPSPVAPRPDVRGLTAFVADVLDVSARALLEHWLVVLTLLEGAADGRGPRAPAWTSDGAVGSCQRCDAGFTVLARRHHCRLCGSVVCRECTCDGVELLPFASQATLRPQCPSSPLYIPRACRVCRLVCEWYNLVVRRTLK